MSVPRRRARGTGRDAVGADRGFGFIKSDNGGPDIFFHARAGDNCRNAVAVIIPYHPRRGLDGGKLPHLTRRIAAGNLID